MSESNRDKGYRLCLQSLSKLGYESDEAKKICIQLDEDMRDATFNYKNDEEKKKEYGEYGAYAEFADEEDIKSYESEQQAEALQYGKPPKNDPRKTPAPKKDRKKGSKVNKKDSAKDSGGKITFSAATTAKLRKMMKDHNEKSEINVSMGMLKAVYRRGAGAYSNSHHPSMSRDGWAMARVRAFMYLVKNGRPSNPNYKQDNDLLPKKHKRSTAEQAIAEMDPKDHVVYEDGVYNVYDFVREKVIYSSPDQKSAEDFAVKNHEKIMDLEASPMDVPEDGQEILPNEELDGKTSYDE